MGHVHCGVGEGAGVVDSVGGEWVVMRVRGSNFLYKGIWRVIFFSFGKRIVV
ncbi:hypothetical protein MNL13_06550 [Bartonella krasnovii]|uniref:Transmembrane protein n=1 Tax=Bartonella krasnovii TaxID=2267275 RepID=A0ABY3VWF6_9HYPH|nr:hypothetical protein [Bartonella krasnovii]UNF28860.1 hypothetical protein MNL13_06550 [Bartonella krasnovii]UNF36857.1 hypothetical protein MNL11_07205 [Bartonella krasnovii]UNF46780.1 hypothetical protein MNL05_06900 [Bartonella krasnovii]UNF48410.1 hypothetical protein MNL04_06850 [Bartonella krasnovii]UNF51791.1 hypothetical protein MNL02_06980 [Bartonella krasnovii]